MARCFELAKRGLGAVSPNPMVGAVLVYNGAIIAEGWHKQYGGPHAEVDCLANVKAQDKAKIPNSTMYVSLEPCAHQGKTPPCANLLVKHKIKRVVIANTDPNPLVTSKGIKILQNAGIEVVVGISDAEGQYLNRRFFSFHKLFRPYIILKWAQSADGFFTKDNSNQHWITGAEAKKLVHKWRYEEDAVLVGTNTARVDNPQLTNRYFEDKGNPIRVVIDKNLNLKKDLNLFNTDASTIIINAIKDAQHGNVKLLNINYGEGLMQNLMDALASENIQSLIIEGGLNLLQQFIDADLWDEARVFTGTIEFKKGLKAPTLKEQATGKIKIGDDTLNTYYKS